jgi:oxygen-independent coproporphyrinogen-3 oxidase
MPGYLRAVERDLQQEAQERPGGPLQTVYVGGGTPSMMTSAQSAQLMARVEAEFGLEPAAESTIEAHPNTVDAAKLDGFRAAGMTRVSFGVESLHRSELDRVGRDYDAGLIVDLVRTSRDVGFGSVALDLIYGLPDQSLTSWRQTLQGTLATGADHLSLYPLSIEPRTVFARRQREGTLRVPADEAVVEMYHLACAELRGAGFVHYEISNWARDGHQCRHNLAYWLNDEYYGVGTGAHAYLKPHRTQRVAGVKRYIERVTAGADPVDERERIDRATETAETLILRLRLLQRGLDLAAVPMDRLSDHSPAIRQLLDGGLVRIDAKRLVLTESAVPVANEVIQLLM